MLSPTFEIKCFNPAIFILLIPGAIMADALCGPSNALQTFQKQTSVDRTLQQDRLAARQAQLEVGCHAPLLLDGKFFDFVSPLDLYLGLMPVFSMQSSKLSKQAHPSPFHIKNLNSPLKTSRSSQVLNSIINQRRVGLRIFEI